MVNHRFRYVVCSALLGCSAAAAGLGETGGGGGGKTDHTDGEKAPPTQVKFTNGYVTYGARSLSETKPAMSVRAGLLQIATWSLPAAREAIAAADNRAGCADRLLTTGTVEEARAALELVRSELVATGLSATEKPWRWEALVGDPDSDEAPVNAAIVSAPTVLNDASPGCDGVELLVQGVDGTIVQAVIPVRSPDATTRPLTDVEGVFWPNAADAALKERMDSYGYNGASSIGQHDPAAVNVEALVAQIRAIDIEKGGCEAPTRIRTGVEPVLEAVDALMDDQNLNPFTVSGYVSVGNEEATAESVAADGEAFLDLLMDPANLAVVSSTWPEVGNPENEYGDAPESCLYYEFYVLRADGTALDIEFNFTD